MICSCDLLEKSYLCGINNNLSRGKYWSNSVVICLKSLTFVVSITTCIIRIASEFRCDLLEKSYLCGINNNHNVQTQVFLCVVICLKSLTFVVSITTLASGFIAIVRCDLLEKSYLCGINNNVWAQNVLKRFVVICLKSLTFVVSITTLKRFVAYLNML